VGGEHLGVGGRPGPVDGLAGGVGEGLQFQRGNDRQLLFRVAAELRADGREGTILPGVLHLETGFDLPLGYEPGRLANGVVGIIHAAGQQRPVGQDRDFGRGGLGNWLGAPAAVARRELVGLREGALKTVALHLLHPLRQQKGGERLAFAARGGQNPAAHDDFGLQEGGLVQQVIAVGVVAGHLEGDDVCARLELVGEVPLVHPEKAMRAAGGAVRQELAVKKNPVDRAARGAQQNLVPRGRVEAGAESDGDVLLGLAPFGPERFGGHKGRRRGGKVRARQQQAEQRQHPGRRAGSRFARRSDKAISRGLHVVRPLKPELRPGPIKKGGPRFGVPPQRRPGVQRKGASRPPFWLRGKPSTKG